MSNLPKRFSAARILVCADEIMLAADVSEDLKRLGYEIAGSVCSGDEAIRAAEVVCPDLILMDIKPEVAVDRIRAAQNIRERMDIPVVYLTAFAEEDVLERGKQIEPYGCLTRPVDLAELRGTVETAVCKHRADKRVKESEALYKALLETTGSGYHLLDKEGRVLEANNEYARLTGHKSVEEVIGRSVLEWTAERSKHRNAEELKKCLERGFVRNVEIDYENSIGRITTVEMNATVIYRAEGPYIIALCRDITERKQAQEALEESEEKYRVLFSKERDAIALIDADSHEILDINNAAENLYGYSREELIGKNALMLSGEPEESKKAFVSAVSQGRIEAPLRWHRKKDGTVFPIEISIDAFILNGRQVACTIVRDLTGRKKAEEALRESEEKLRLVTETIEDVFWMTSPGIQEVIYVSPAYERVWARSREALYESPTSFMDSVHPEDRGQVRRVIEEHQQGSWTCEYRIVQPDGAIRWIHDRGYPIWDEKGNLRLRTGVATDITDRKKAEQALRDSEERLRLAWETIPDAVSISRMEDGTFVDVNNGFTICTGYSREEVLGRSALEIGIWHDPASRGLFVSRLERDRHVRGFEAKIRGKDGRLRTFLMSAAHMTLNGEPHILFVGKDIELLCQAVEALRKSEEKYRHIFDNAHEGIFQTTPGGRLISANLALARMFGYASPEEMISEVTDIASQVYANPEDREDLRRRFENKAPLTNQEIQFRRKDGAPIWVSLNVHGAPDEDGKVLYYEGTVEDITARKLAEEALRESEDRYRSVFNSAAVGINLKSPDGALLEVNQALAGILGYDQSELIGVSYLDVSRPDDVHLSKKMQAALVRGDIDTYRVEQRCFSKDGRVVWVDATVTALRDSLGRLRSIVDVVADITERKNAEEALRESEQRLSQIINFLPDATFAIDREGKVIAWNRAMEKMTGVPAEEMIGQGDHAYTVPFYGCRRPALIDLALAPHEEIRQAYLFLEGDKETFTGEAINARPLGRNLILWGKASCLYDMRGNVVGAIETIRDITERKKAEEALRESEEKFSTAFRSAPNPMKISSLEDGTVIEVNDEFVAAYGYERSEVVGKTALALGIWRDADQRSSWLRLIMNKGYARNLDLSISTKDGRLRQVLSSTVTVHLQGKPFLLSTHNDVTERKEAEEALRVREHTLRSILLATPVGLCLTENQHIKWANVAWASMFGFTDESEYVGQPSSIMYGSDAPYLTVKAAAYDNLDRGIVGEAYTDFMRKDGSPFRGHLRSTYLDPSDPAKGMLSAISDLTEITRSEQARRESEKRYRVLFEDSRDAVFVTAQDGSFMEANKAFCTLFGYDRNELEGTSSRQMYADSGFGRAVHEAMEKHGSTKDFPIQFRKKNGTVFEGLLTASVRYGGKGEVLGYQGIIRDVTERKQLEKQLLQAQKMEAIGTLAGGVAHDFNNILTVVQGFSELLLAEMDEGAPGYSDLRNIHEVGRRGAELVRSLLTFSRKADTNPRRINLNDEVARMEKLLSRTIPKMIKIELHLDSELASVNADPHQMGQVLMNLAVNAEQAMPDGGDLTIATANIRVDEEHCRSYPEMQPGNYVLLTVSDTGHGMDTETSEHIFEPFFTTKDIGQGTGLGLAMVYGIIRQHEGYVSCHSEPNEGATFKIYLPALPIADIESGAGPEEALPPGGAEAILLVDDEDSIRDLGAKLLTRAGYKVLTAGGGPSAMELYLKHGEQIALVIVDLIMPGMGGDVCLEEILAINPDAKIIICSGAAIEGERKETVESRAKGFVRKPFQLREMLRIVREVLDAK